MPGGAIHDIVSTAAWANPLSWFDRAFNQGRGTERFANWVQEQANGVGDGLGLQNTGVANPYQVAPTAGQINTAPSDEARAQQMALIAQLQRSASGVGPSLAQHQLQQATDANLQSALALGASQQPQGLSPQAALRGIADQQARIQQDAVGQAGLLRLQEAQNAQNMLGNVLSGTRGQDMSLAGAQAGNELERERLAANTQLGYDTLNTGMRQREFDRRAGVLGGIGQGLVQGGKMLATGMSGGGPVLGRARAAGDSASNDTVPAMLSPGEIVLPRSVAQDDDAPEKAAAFVAAIKRRKDGAGKSPAGHMRRLEALEKRLRALEAA